MDRTRLAGRVALGAAGVAVLGVALALVGVSTAGAGLLAVGVGVLAFVRPDVGLWLVLIVFPFHPLLMRVAEVDFGLGGTPFLVISAWKEIAIAGMLGALIVSYVGSADPRSLRRAIRRLTLPDYFAVALALFVVVGLLFDRSFLALSQARLLLFPLGVYIGGRANLIPGIRMFKTVTVAGAVIAVFGIIQSSLLGWSFVERYYSAPGLPRPYTFTAQFLDGPRAAGTLLSPNEFAFLMVIYAVMAGALIYRLPSRQKVRFAPILAAFVVALALSFSRSALIASVAGFATMLLLLPRLAVDRRRTALTLASAIAPALLLTVLIYAERGGGALIANTIQTLVGSGPASSPTVIASPGPGVSPSLTPGRSPKPVETAAPDPSTVGHVEFDRRRSPARGGEPTRHWTWERWRPTRARWQRDTRLHRRVLVSRHGIDARLAGSAVGPRVPHHARLHGVPRVGTPARSAANHRACRDHAGGRDHRCRTAHSDRAADRDVPMGHVRTGGCRTPARWIVTRPTAERAIPAARS